MRAFRLSLRGPQTRRTLPQECVLRNVPNEDRRAAERVLGEA